MIRFVLVALVLIVVWVLLLKLFKELKSSNTDWRSVGFIVGFVALAIYLSYATGIGGIG